MALLDKENGKLLVVAPHGDDEVLGAGGLIARALDRNWEVYVFFATSGGYTNGGAGDDVPEWVSMRLSKIEKAAQFLGITSYEVLDSGTGECARLDTLTRRVMISAMEDSLARIRPDIVAMPCRGHYHQDHRLTAEICLGALRPAPDGRLPFVPCVLAYGHTGAGWGGEGFQFQPNAFIDITDVMDRKLEALNCYESQICPAPHPRNPEAMRKDAEHWGFLAGCKYAEAYECMRMVETA